MTRQTIAAALAAILIVPSLISPGFAQERGREQFDHRGQPERREEFNHRERFDHRFADRDWDRWHSGRWFHGPHGGHDGWWWVIGDSWYFYPAPVYPYPDPAVLPAIAAPPATVVTPAPAVQQQCREYQGDAIINDSKQPFYGTACLEPDGQWHIVNR
jgi:hypothetical protein